MSTLPGNSDVPIHGAPTTATPGGLVTLGAPLPIVIRVKAPLIARAIREDELPVVPEPVRALVSAQDRLATAAAELAARPLLGYKAHLDAVTADLARGEELPQDFAEQVVSTLRANDERQAETVAMNILADNVSTKLRLSLREHLDEMLAGLAGDLTLLLADVHGEAEILDNLDPTDGEAVADATAEQRAAIGSLKDLRPRYKRLRSQQQNLIQSAHEEPGALWGAQTWVGVFRARVHEFSDIPNLGAPSEDLPTGLWFRQLIHRDDVWLPTLGDLQGAWHAYHGRPLAQPAIKVRNPLRTPSRVKPGDLIN